MAIELKAERDDLHVHVAPDVQTIRAMLDRDEVAAARTLLSAALKASPDAPELLRLADVLAMPNAIRRPVNDFDRCREHAWLAAHAHVYRGRWVAVAGSELVGSAASLAELLALLESSGARSLALVHRVD